MEEKYFVINNSEGDTRVEELTEKALQERLKDGYYGRQIGFINRIGNPDTNYWGENILIIKGTKVTPVPVEVVKEYRL
jgi:hypothetical protein